MEKETEDIVTWKEIQERHPAIPKENLHKLVLVCKNCGRKDLLVKFLKKREAPFRRAEPVIDWEKMKLKEPYKKWYPKKNYYSKSKNLGFKPNKTLIADETDKLFKFSMNLDFASPEEYFFCPNCGSSLVCLSSEFSKNNLVRIL